MATITFKRPDIHKPRTKNRLRRCLDIFFRLQKGPVAVVTLSRIFNVSERSIERDIKALSAAGIKLEKYEYKGWYRLPGIKA